MRSRMASISVVMIPTNPSRPETQYIRSSQPARPTWDVDADPTKMAILWTSIEGLLASSSWSTGIAPRRRVVMQEVRTTWPSCGARHGLHVSLSLVDHFPQMGRCQSGGYLARGYLSKPDGTEDEGSEIARIESDDSPRRMVWPRLTFKGDQYPIFSRDRPQILRQVS